MEQPKDTGWESSPEIRKQYSLTCTNCGAYAHIEHGRVVCSDGCGFGIYLLGSKCDNTIINIEIGSLLKEMPIQMVGNAK